MTPEEEIRKAGKAKEILGNELFKQAVAAIKEALETARLNSSATDVALREKLWAQEVALHSIVSQITHHIDTGMLAEKTLLDRARELLEIN